MNAKENVVHQKPSVRRMYEERRSFQRIQLQVPLFVRGKDAQGEQFLELAKTLNISCLGAFIACQRSLTLNDVITLIIPSPSLTPSALVPASMPPIQARIKRQQEAGDVFLVAAEFLKSIG